MRSFSQNGDIFCFINQFFCFVHPIFRFLFFVTFDDEVTKIQKYYIIDLCLYFARQDGQDGKNRKENHATKVTKIPKKQKMKIWDQRNISSQFSS